MLIVRPGSVVFDGAALAGVVRMAVERTASRELEEWQDTGPYCVFVDVPERRVRIKVEQELGALEPSQAGLWPGPGAIGLLVVETARHAGDGDRTRLSTSAVVTDVRYALPGRTGPKAAVRTIELLAVSADGAVDPVAVERVR